VKKWKEGIPVFETGQHPESSLPFSFGVEFELQLRVKNGTGLDIGNYPAAEASFSVMRRYNFSLLESIAEILTQEGMDAVRHDMSSDDPLDYSKWNVVLDGSLSKAHMKDGYCEFQFHEGDTFPSNNIVIQIQSRLLLRSYLAMTNGLRRSTNFGPFCSQNSKYYWTLPAVHISTSHGHTAITQWMSFGRYQKQ
jgi:hypothetical protein